MKRHIIKIFLVIMLGAFLNISCSEESMNRTLTGLLLESFDDLLLVKDPAVALKLAQKTWRRVVAEMIEHESVEKDDACNDSDHCPLKRAMWGGEVVPRKPVALRTHEQIIADREKRCGYFSLTDGRLIGQGWEDNAKTMNDFVTHAVNASVSACERIKDRPVSMISLGSQGHFTDLIILEQLFNRFPLAHVKFWCDAPERVHSTFVEKLDEKTQQLLDTQLLRWIQVRHPHVKFQYLKLPETGKLLYCSEVDVPDVLYARDELRGKQSGEKKKKIVDDYKGFYEKARYKQHHLQGVMVYFSDVHTRLYLNDKPSAVR